MKEYPKDTLGYHYSLSVAVFGENSKATRFLQEKINEDPDGMYGKVIVPEEQVVYLLGQMHLGD